ncbi:MAG: hypothetical protein JNK76_24155 [Planctomycetales bacterium]|nr:hypothetical protein [Planctomycetales bacterium]
MLGLKIMSEPPISYADLKALFEWLSRPNPSTSGHSFDETIEFLTSRNLPVDTTIEWLKCYGGYDDAEVIYNVADEWSDKVGFIFDAIPPTTPPQPPTS